MKVNIIIGSLLALAQAYPAFWETTEPEATLVQEQYGDVTVHITKRKEGTDMVPERYSEDSDDALMNNLIAKGYAFSRDKNAGIKIEVDCGCNCNCCSGKTKTDLWELSKDCGCNCGCCNMNSFKSKSQPQFWMNKEGAEKAAREIVQKNKKLEGVELDDYINHNFGTLWDTYDVLGNNMVEVE